MQVERLLAVLDHPLVGQLVDAPGARHPAFFLADQAANRNFQPQLGVDGREVAHAGSVGPCAGVSSSPNPLAPDTIAHHLGALV